MKPLVPARAPELPERLSLEWRLEVGGERAAVDQQVQQGRRRRIRLRAFPEAVEELVGRTECLVARLRGREGAGDRQDLLFLPPSALRPRPSQSQPELGKVSLQRRAQRRVGSKPLEAGEPGMNQIIERDPAAPFD